MPATQQIETPERPPPRSEPLISVLVPLDDARGEVTDHLRTWTHEQTLPRDRYQVVLACRGDAPETERRVAALLSTQDLLVRVSRAEGLTGLWNSAAARSRAPWLVMTEAHCAADPECLASVARAIQAEPELAAATLEHAHIAHTSSGRMSARWFREVYRAWDAEDWRHLNLVGIAVNRRAYESIGPLDPEYGLFCAPFFSARLHERGARIGHVADAVVHHVHNDTIGEHQGHSADYTRGECEARAAHDAAFCERYFGHDSIWTNRFRYDPGLARTLAGALARSVARAAVTSQSELPWLARELAARLPACVAGTRPYIAHARLALAWSEHGAERLSLGSERRFSYFLRAQERVVALTRLKWVRDHAASDEPALDSPGLWPVEEVPPEALIGVHGLEGDSERRFRWSEPVCLVRTRPSTGDRRLILDTAGLRGPPLSYVRDVYVGTDRLPRASLRDDGKRLIVPLPPVPMGTEPAAITILCRPLEPSRHGSPDRRRLGLPVCSVELRPGS